MCSSMSSSMSLLELPWDHVLMRYVLPLLSPCDWLRLRVTSMQHLHLVTTFITENRCLTLLPGHRRSHKILVAGAVKLQRLCFLRCSWLTDDILRPILSSATRLRELQLAGCQGPGLSTASLFTLGLKCLSVASLSLPECPWVTAEAVEFICSQKALIVKMRTSTRGGIGERESGGIHEINSEDAVRIFGASGLRTKPEQRKKSKFTTADALYHSLQSSARVRKINLRSLGTNPSAARHPLAVEPLTSLAVPACHLNDPEVAKLAACCPHLTRLSIAGNFPITDATMAAVSKHIKGLRELDIRGCDQLTDKGLVTVAKHCTHLKSVNLTGGVFSKKVLKFVKDKGISLYSPQIGGKGMSPLPLYKLPDIPNISNNMLQQLQG